MRRHHFLRRTIQWFALVLSLPYPLLGQPSRPTFEQIPIAIACCFLQDSNGFLWIGSQEGLARYDGYHLKFYTHIPFDSTSLSEDWVTVIKEDRKGNLWVGTWGGALNYFDQRTEKFTRFLHEASAPESVRCKNIRDIVVNDDGTLWIATRERGLLHMSFDSNGTAVYRRYDFSTADDARQRARDNVVWSLLKDREGNLWVGTLRIGLICLDVAADTFRHYRHDPRNPASLNANSVSSLCEDDSGNVWIGTGIEIANIKGNGLSKFDRRTQTFTTFKHDPRDSYSICSNSPTSLLIDHTNTLWIGTSDNGLCSIRLDLLDDGLKPRFVKHTDVGSNIINSLYEDRLGNIWVGVFDLYMCKYDGQKNPFIWYRNIPGNPNSLSSSGIECLYVDKENMIWFGHHFGGLSRFDPATGNYRRYRPDPRSASGVSSQWVSSICEDKDGTLWVGTFECGIDVFNPVDESFKHIRADPANRFGLKLDKIGFLLRNRAGDIWVSTTNQALQLYDHADKHFTVFDVDSSTSDDETITVLYEDSRGTLWIGTMNNGLYAVTVEDRAITNVRHYVHNPKDTASLTNNCVSDVIRSTVPDSNSLWIATGAGLNRLDLKTVRFTHYFTADGLPHNMVLKVLEDREGNVWASTAYALCVLNVKTGQFSSYGKEDGLPFIDFGGVRQNTTVTRDGQLLFGGASGALGFYPEEVINSPNVPHVRLTDFKILHKSVHLDSAIAFKRLISLNHDQNTFSFEFTDLNFSASKRNRFAYKLEGLHDDWAYIDNQRVASFANIDPGRYVFTVKGSNNHGIWNEEEASVVIVIFPPWWATWWFRSAAVLILAGVAFALYKYRVSKLIALERLRLRIAGDLHDDIGSRLGSITLANELVARHLPPDHPDRRRLMDVITLARETATDLRDVVWIINPDQDKLDDLVLRMRETADRMLPGIHHRFNKQGTTDTAGAPMELKRQILLIFKEAIHNIARHARATDVDVLVSVRDAMVRLSVRDDGVGFDLSDPSSGNGLKNMERRARAIGGDLSIRSSRGEGTTVTLEVKIPRRGYRL